MSRMRPLALAIVLVACGGTPKEETTPRPPALCEKVADHLVGIMREGKEDAPPEAIDKVTRSLIDTCKTTLWSGHAQECFLALKAFDEQANRCAEMLTIEQRDAAGAAIDAAFPKKTDEQAPAPRPPAASEAPPLAPPPPAPAPVVPQGAKRAISDDAAPKDAPKQRAPRSPAPKTGDPCDGGE
jgi:hypothetical protein